MTLGKMKIKGFIFHSMAGVSNKQTKSKKTLESLHETYEAEYCEYDRHYWYNVFLDIHLLYLQCNDGIVNEVQNRVTTIINKLSSV